MADGGLLRKVSEGKEGQPEASLGCIVFQRRSEGGSKEAFRALRPGEPYTGFRFREGLSDEWVVDGVDIAGGAGTYCHEDAGFCGLDLLGEQPGRHVSHVCSLEAEGLQAEL